MAEKIHALLVDDEENVRFVLSKTLRKQGYAVVAAASGEAALDHLRDTRFDLAVIDLHLGGKIDGLKVLEAVRWRWPETVVIILTGHGTLESAMAAIREGVDGYLLKPAEPDEVRRAAQEALARKRQAALPAGSLLRHGGLSLDLQKHQALLEGAPLELTPGEFKLLTHLMQNKGRVVAPLELVQAAQGYASQDEREAREIVKWYIHRLRRKIEADPANPRYILNVRGVGYILGEQTA